MTVSLLRNKVGVRLNGVGVMVAMVPLTFSGIPATGMDERGNGGLKFLDDLMATVSLSEPAGVVVAAVKAIDQTVLFTTVTVPGFFLVQPERLRAITIGMMATKARRFIMLLNLISDRSVKHWSAETLAAPELPWPGRIDCTDPVSCFNQKEAPFCVNFLLIRFRLPPCWCLY
jgi:hypothetical protein